VFEVAIVSSSQFSGACRVDADSPHRRLDIRVIPKDHFACGILYFTGSDQFNKEMRAFALEKVNLGAINLLIVRVFVRNGKILSKKWLSLRWKK